MIGDVLYRLTARDNASVWHELVSNSKSLSALATSIQIGFQVPADRAFKLTTVASLGIPGGAQTVTSSGFRLFIPSVVSGSNFYQKFNVAAGQVAENWDGELWCPPSSSIQVTLGFSSGALSNTSVVALHGVLIPRGVITEGTLI